MFRRKAPTTNRLYYEDNLDVLRGPDALHLAVAALGGHALATLDAWLAEGAQAVGVRVVGVA